MADLPRSPDVLNETFEFIGLLAPDGTVLDANQPALEFCGVSIVDIVGKPFWETPWWSWSQAEQERLKLAIAEGARGQFVRFVAQHRDFRGTIEDVDFSLSPVMNERGQVMFLIPEGRRVTEFTHQSEELRHARDELQARLARRLKELATTNRALVESQSRLERAEALNQSLIETAVDGIVVINATGQIELFNSSAERLFGYSKDEALGRNVTLLMPLAYGERHDDYLTSYLSTGERRIIGIGREVEGRHRSGRTFPIWLSVSEMTVGGERKFTGIVHDLTERRRAETESRLQRERFDLAARGAVDGLVEWDFESREPFLSERAYTLIGRRPDKFTPTIESVVAAIHPEDREPVAEALAHHLKDRTPFNVEFRLRTGSGDYRWFHSSGQAIWNDDGQPLRMAGSIVDISRRREAEEALRQQATLVQLGQMAAVVAHEVRNPIAGVRGVIDVLVKRRPPGDPERAIMLEMASRLVALDQLVEDLLVFARPKAISLGQTSLLSVLASAASVIRSTPDFDGVELTLPTEDAQLVADADVLGRAFLNILINAAQAMQGRGRIVVSATRDAKSMRVTVADTGPGMPPHVQEHLFEPFFTTKKRGTGLGLLVTRRAITQHGGALEIESTVGVGTRVHVRLPLEPTAASEPSRS
ncbi:MAG: PAS domain S-box protein [Vicinamibacterales bacterium]